MRELILAFDEEAPEAAAFRENGQLIEYIDIAGSKGVVGAVYAARITEYIRAYGACFAEIGEERRGYLSADRYRAGEWVLCQANGEAHEKKGIRLTDNVKLSGAYLVLLQSGMVGISSKIQDPNVRVRLEQLGRMLLAESREESLGMILRTESQYVSEAVIRKEFEQLLQRGREIRRRFEEARRNGCPRLLQCPDLLQKILYRYPPSTVTRVIGDSAAALHALTENHPAFLGKTELCRGRAMESCNIHRELTTLVGRRVWLKSGAYLVFDKTEAMTVVDVNSGKMSGGRNPAGLALRVNLEAAGELMRQLRLRSLGGIIVCDLIDMESEEDRLKVLNMMRELAEMDPEETEIHDITRLGLAEITRKRTKNADYLDKAE